MITARSWHAAAVGGLLGAWGCGSPDGGSGPDTTGHGPTYQVATLVQNVEFIPPSFTTGQPTQAHLAADNAAVYWIEGTENALRRIAATGGTPVTVAVRAGVPLSARVRGPHIYWIDSRSGIAPSGCTGAGAYAVLKQTRLDGTAETRLALGDRCAGGTPDLVVDATHVFWVTSVSSPNTYTIRKVAVTGDASTALVTGGSFREIMGLAADSAYVYWEEATLDSGQVLRIPKAGGSIDTLARGLRTFRGGLVAAGGYLYFGDTDFFDEHRVLKLSTSGGPVQILADITGVDQTGAKTPRRIVVATPSVYWVDSGAVHAVPIDSGAVTTPVSGLVSGVDLAISASDAYWIETRCCAHRQLGKLKRAPLAGGGTTVVQDSLAAPTTLTLDGTAVYWTEGGPIASAEGYGRIARSAVTGGAVTTVASGVSHDFPPIAVDGANVYIADGWTIKRVPVGGGKVERLAIGDFYIQDIATDGSYVYWIEDPISVVKRVSVTGGAVTALGAGTGAAGPMDVDASYVYWLDNFNTIRRVLKGGGSPAPVASNLGFLDDIAVDAASVFYAEHDTARIRQVPSAGGAATTLSLESNFASPHFVTQNSVDVFWINQARVAAVPKTGTPADTRQIAPVLTVPGFWNSITAAGGSVYWTDLVAGTIKKATRN